VDVSDQDDARKAPETGLEIVGRRNFEHTSHLPKAVDRSRRLRRDMTVSEKKLWSALKKLDLGFRRQAPIGRYIADFAKHSAKLVVEVDGPSHDLAEDQLYDHERDEWLRSQGYRVVRVSDREVYADADAVAERIAGLMGI
jgi:very-short-patch-repair endonuclease